MSFFTYKKPTKPVILIDTREKNPWLFEKYGVRVIKKGLKSGDYSVKGLNLRSGVFIERKAVNDLYSTSTAQIERFKRELDRLKECVLAGGFVALVVEADLGMLKFANRRTVADPTRVYSMIHKLCVVRGIAPYFCSGREMAEKQAYLLLRSFWAAKNGVEGL
jgi:ERCC4-type nuclease